MKIKQVDSFVVHIPFDDERLFTSEILFDNEDSLSDPMINYPPAWRTSAIATDKIGAVIVRIETDNKIVGWGEIHAPIVGEASKAIVDHLLAPILYGEDPRDIRPLWEKMYATMRSRGHMGGYQLEAISGIDIALWDIVGQAVKAPIAKLLGSKIRDRIPVYASALPAIPCSSGASEIQQIVDRAKLLVGQGFRTIKLTLNGNIDLDEAVLKQLRNSLGDEIGLVVYAHGFYDLVLAKKVGQMLQQYNVKWLEDPLSPENLRDYSRLTKFLDIAIAGGSGLHNRWQFNDCLAVSAFDIIQPNVSRAGGISECSRITTLADTYGLPFAPQVSQGTAIHLAATLQWAGSGLNLMICEYPLDQSKALEGILKTPHQIVDGQVLLNDEPGLGIEIDEARLMQYVS